MTESRKSDQLALLKDQQGYIVLIPHKPRTARTVLTRTDLYKFTYSILYTRWNKIKKLLPNLPKTTL